MTLLCLHCRRTVNPARKSKAGWWCPACKELNPPPSADPAATNRRTFILALYGAAVATGKLAMDLAKTQQSPKHYHESIGLAVGFATVTGVGSLAFGMTVSGS